MRRRMAISAPIVLSLLAGCGEDSGTKINPDLPGGSDLFPSYDYYIPPSDGGPQDRYTPPTGDGATPLPDGGGDAAAVPPAKCGGTATVALQEVSTGTPDYVAIKNTGGATVALANFTLVMTGINVESYTFKAGDSVAAGKVLYAFEYSSGQTGDVNTGANIPFYDAEISGSQVGNAVALYDPAGNLLDFVAIGDTVVGLPPNATATLVTWPSAYDPATQSFQRVAMGGKCPAFVSSDWAAKALTRP